MQKNNSFLSFFSSVETKINTLTKEIVLVTLITLIGLASLFLRTDRLTYSHPDFHEIWDHHFYMEIATGHPTDEERIAPFEYRILNPLLASLLPFDILINFTILNITALYLTGVVLYFMLRTLEFSKSLALTGLIFYLASGWATRYNIYDFWLTDPMSFVFTIVCMWSIFAKKDFLLLLLLAIGVTAKENVLFVAPLYYTFNAKKIIDTKILFKTLYLSLPALLILFSLRTLIPTTNADYNLLYLIETIGIKRIGFLIKEPNEYFLLFSIGTFGFSLIILPFFSLKQNLLMFLKFSPFIILTYSSLLFAHNTERLIISAFPAIIIMALFGIKNIINQTGIQEFTFIFLPLSLFLLLLVRKDWLLVLSVYEAIILLLFLAFSLQTKRQIEKPPT